LNLNLFENLKKDRESNTSIKNFMQELSDFLKDMTSSTNKNKNIINEEERLKNNRKEGHLYFVTEDRNNEIYLWDFTDKPKYEFKEIVSSEELRSLAKEGAMLQYKNGKYDLYSSHGYEMLFNEKNGEKNKNE